MKLFSRDMGGGVTLTITKGESHSTEVPETVLNMLGRVLVEIHAPPGNYGYQVTGTWRTQHSSSTLCGEISLNTKSHECTLMLKYASSKKRAVSGILRLPRKIPNAELLLTKLKKKLKALNDHNWERVKPSSRVVRVPSLEHTQSDVQAVKPLQTALMKYVPRINGAYSLPSPLFTVLRKLYELRAQFVEEELAVTLAYVHKLEQLVKQNVRPLTSESTHIMREFALLQKEIHLHIRSIDQLMRMYEHKLTKSEALTLMKH